MSIMNKNILLTVVLALFFVTLVSAQDYAKGQIVVGFNEGIGEEEAKNLVLSKELTFQTHPNSPDYSPNLRNLVVYVPEGKELDWAMEFEKESVVKYAELNYIAYAASTGTPEPEEVVEDEPPLVEDIVTEPVEEIESITEQNEETEVTDQLEEDSIQDSTKNNAVYYIIGIVILIGLILFWILRRKK